MRKIDLCKGGLQLADIGTKNVSEPDLTPRIMRTETEHLFKRGDRVQASLRNKSSE